MLDDAPAAGQRGVLMPVGTLRYWAAAREAAGVAEERYDAGTLAEALDGARSRHGQRLGVVLDRCSYVVDGAPVGGRDHAQVQLRDGDTIEVLPPFAGGSADDGQSDDGQSDDGQSDVRPVLCTAPDVGAGSSRRCHRSVSTWRPR